MYLLHELLLSRLTGIRIDDGSDDPSRTVLLDKTSLTEVGFAAEEGLLDYDHRSFLGYRLLSEYFAFPEKFLFLDLAGLDAPALRHPGTTLRIQFFLERYGNDERHNRLQQTLSPGNFKLGCTPAINLFRQAAEPIRLSHQRESYAVVPDSRKPRSFEIISVDSVTRVEKVGTRESSERIPPSTASASMARNGCRTIGMPAATDPPAKETWEPKSRCTWQTWISPRCALKQKS